MTKFLLKYSIVFVLVMFMGYGFFYYFSQSITQEIRLSPLALFTFHTIFSLFLCITLAKLRTTQKFAEQVGFIYLGSVFIKVVLFSVLFRNTFFSEIPFTNIETINLLIPLFLGLFFEVFFLSRLLGHFSKIKNE